VAALAVVEDLDEVEHGGLQRLAGWPVVAGQQLAFQGGEKLSATALSSASPMVPIEATRPVSVRRLPNARLVYWQPWSV
jgi:hypothetical protein